MKFKNVVLAGATLGIVILLLVGCGGSGDTVGPSRDVYTPEVAQSTPAAQPVEPTAAAPAPQVSDYWQKRVYFGNNGGLTINADDKVYNGERCYFINGPHPQEKLFESPTTAPANHAQSFDVPDLASLIENDTCDPMTVGIQADAGAGTFDCSNPSNRLADSGTADLHAYKYFDIEVPAGREPGEWKVVSEESVTGDWGSCERFEASCKKCTECREVVTTIVESNGCEERTRTETEIEKKEVPCPEPTPPPGPQCEVVVRSSTGGNPFNECSDLGGFVCKIEDDGSMEGNCDGFIGTDTNGSEWGITVPYDTNTALVKSSRYLEPASGDAGNQSYRGHRYQFFGTKYKDISHVTFCGCPR